MKESSMNRRNLKQRATSSTAGIALRKAICTLGLAAGIAFCAATASAATLTVGVCQPGSYSTIQAAVNAAVAGDTVRVCPGEYPEDVFINKNLTLAGINAKRQLGVPTIVYPADTDRPECPPQTEGLCPQILVQDAKATITGMRIDDSAFPQQTCLGEPAGIIFLDAQGTVSSDTIVNQSTICDSEGSGIGVLALYSTNSETTDFSLDVSNNTLTNFGAYGVIYDAFLSGGNGSVTLMGSVTGNTVTPVQPGVCSILLDGVDRVNVTSNNISGAGEQDSSLGINSYYSVKPSFSNNTVSNTDYGIQLWQTGSATVNGNSFSNIGGAGITLLCADKNSVTSNKVIDSPNVGAVGVDIIDCGTQQPGEGSDKNQIDSNKFSGLCGGILEGSTLNTGNSIVGDSFSNISPGADLMAGNNCP